MHPILHYKFKIRVNYILRTNFEIFKVTAWPCIFFFTEDNLEATLAKCDEFLSSFDVPTSSKNWETRMSYLTSNWDSSRKQLIEAVLSCKGLPSPNYCNLCFKGQVRLRCMECPIKFMCSSCDEKAHQFLPSHNRDGYITGYFQAIPPTTAVDENGIRQSIGMFAVL